MKAFLCVLSVLLLLSAAGCGRPDENSPTESDTASQTASSSQTVTADSSPAATEPAGRTLNIVFPSLGKLLHDISGKYGSEQIILTYQISEDEPSKGMLIAYEKNGSGDIEPVLEGIEVVFGKNGLNKEKEGDKRSPSGVYRIPFAFGRYDLEDELSIGYRIATEHDYWVDDAGSDDYNTWQTYDKDPATRWASFERLNIPSYRLAFVIDYNSERIKGKGSAIFFHVWKDAGTFTSGCTATDEESLYAIIKWMDGKKNPVIVQGSLLFFSAVYGIDILKETGHDPF